MRPGYQASAPLTLPVRVGPAALFIRNDAPTPACVHTRWHIEVEGFNTVPGTSQWSSSNGQVSFYNTTEEGTDIEVGGQAGVLTVTLSRTDRCTGTGQPISASTLIQVSTTQPDGRVCDPPMVYDGLVAYPNPADEYVEIKSQAEASRTAQGQAQLFDHRGQPVGSYAVPVTGLRLPTRSLPSGLYYLTLRQGNHTRRLHFSVRH